MGIKLDNGLTSEDVIRLTEEGYDNIPVGNQSKTIGQIIASNVFTYFNLIFAIFAVLIIMVKSYTDMAFLPIIISNMLIGIIQEIRSKRVLDKLTVLSAPKAKVIRDGIAKEINPTELVKGDIVVFESGNQICADAVVGSGEIRVNESLLTGEADEVIKKCGDELLSGSFVVSGSCKAQLINVGHESYVAKLTLEVKQSRKKKQSEMMQSLDKLVRVIGILIIPIGVALFCQEYFYLHYSIKDSVVSSVAALVGMIPEGLYLLASIALVVSVIRLAKKNVLVHEMACVETLARVDVLCIDKTGTITENVMRVNEIVPLKQYNEFEYPSLHSMIGEFVENMSDDNVTIKTLKEYFCKKCNKKAISIVPFSSVTKFSSVTFEDGIYVLGAPEYVLMELYDEYREIIEDYSKQGYRVLAYGSYEGNIEGETLSVPIIPLALILMSNSIREGAKSTFDYFASQGVDIKVISGDNPIAVSNVSKLAGIRNASSYIDARELTSYADVENAIASYSIFGRVSPEQKKEIVMALKANGHTVAMTGDGVNDVLALKYADCSIAMASGSDAATNAAQIVLLDSDFSRMPSVVFEGRRVVNNIQRSASLFLVKNIFSMLMACLSLLWAMKYPLVPSQLSMLGIFTIGTPAFILAFQPNRSIIKGHFLTNVFLNALPAGLTDFVIVALLANVGERAGIESGQLSTIAIILLLMVGIVTLIRVCIPFDWLRLLLCISMVVGIILSIVFAGGLFSLSPLNSNQAIFLVFLMIISIPLLLTMSWLVDFFTKFIAKHNKTFRNHVGKHFEEVKH